MQSLGVTVGTVLKVTRCVRGTNPATLREPFLTRLVRPNRLRQNKVFRSGHCRPTPHGHPHPHSSADPAMAEWCPPHDGKVVPRCCAGRPALQSLVLGRRDRQSSPIWRALALPRAEVVGFASHTQNVNLRRVRQPPIEAELETTPLPSHPPFSSARPLPVDATV